MLATLTPAAALRADLQRVRPGWTPAAPAGDRDDELATWALVATILARLAALPGVERQRLAARAARALSVRGAGLARALRAWGRGRSGADAVCDAARAVVEDMERAGALSLARSSLAALAALARDEGPVAHGTTLAHLGRVVRQLGDLSAAEALYAAAEAQATVARDDLLAARAAVGMGVVYGQRGNFPAAREAYTRALRLAPAGSPVAAGAHHGLMLAAIGAGDMAAAFDHGWRAFADAAHDPERRADALLNLGGLCRRVGQHEAAIHACRASLALTATPRLRLHAIGIAAMAAAQGGRAELVAAFARQADETITAVGQPYEVANAHLELGEAYARIGDREAALARVRASHAISSRQGYHELAWRAEAAEAALRRPGPTGHAPAAAAAEKHDVVLRVERLPLVAADLLVLR